MDYRKIAQKTFEHYKESDIPKADYYPPEYPFELPELLLYVGTPKQTTTMDTANGLLEKLQDEDAGKVAVLNFASAKYAGGGWLSGANAQEEALCRTSNLYFSINSVPEYYEIGRMSKADYTDAIIYSNGVEFWLNDKGEELDKPYKVDVITCACPNANANGGQMFGFDTYVQRLRKIIHVAELHGVDTLLIGAWGCGVFGNDAKTIKKAINKALTGSRTIKKVYHPIPGPENTYLAFSKKTKDI